MRDLERLARDLPQLFELQDLQIPAWWLVELRGQDFLLVTSTNSWPVAWQRQILQTWWQNSRFNLVERMQWMQSHRLGQVVYEGLVQKQMYKLRNWRDIHFLRKWNSALMVLRAESHSFVILQTIFPQRHQIDPRIWLELTNAILDKMQQIRRHKTFALQHSSSNKTAINTNLDIARLTHDFRKPLSNLIMNHESMQQHLQSHKIHDQELEIFLRQGLDRFGSQLKLLEGFTYDLLNLQATQSKPDKENYQICDLHAIVEEILSGFLNQPAYKDYSIVKDFTKEAPCMAVPNSLYRILYNLISNAFKFASRKGVIYLQTEKRGRWVSFNIEDNGQGLGLENSIFDLARHNIGRGGGGWGLGLASASELAQKMGGRLMHVKARHGEGAHFLLVLSQAL